MKRIEKLLYVLTEKLLRKLCFGDSDQGLVRRTAYGNLYIQRFSIVNKNIFKIEAKFEQASRLEHCGINSLLEVRPSGHWELSYNSPSEKSNTIICAISFVIIYLRCFLLVTLLIWFGY